jgi:hypothetical protein
MSMYRALNGDQGDPDKPSEVRTLATLWERWPGESLRAYQGFCTYRTQGADRSCSKVARELSKSRQLIARWALRWHWQDRVAAFDEYESRIIDKRVILNKAKLRERQVNAALELQTKATERLSAMAVADLSPMEVCAFLKVSGEMVSRDDLEARDFPPDLVPPTFQIQVIRPGHGMVGVQLADGRCGYIPASQVDRFRRENPDAVVII